METGTVKTIVKDLIVDNSATLLSGLTKQGQARIIHRITTSNLTPLDGFYYLAIRVTKVREQSHIKRATTTRNPTRMAEYDLEIDVVDEALVQDTDDSAYEGLHNDFDTFTDRIVSLLKTQTWIGTDPKLKLKRQPGAGDRLIDKIDFTGTALDTEGNTWASLFATLKFTLVDECV